MHWGSIFSGKHILSGEGWRRGMTQDKWRKEGYGRQNRKGWELGILKECEVGEIGGNCATMVNILQSKKGLREEDKKLKKGARICTLRNHLADSNQPLFLGLFFLHPVIVTVPCR